MFIQNSVNKKPFKNECAVRTRYLFMLLTQKFSMVAYVGFFGGGVYGSKWDNINIDQTYQLKLRMFYYTIFIRITKPPK